MGINLKKQYKGLNNSIGIIADDLTGASDTGLQFVNRGLVTLVLSSDAILNPSDRSLLKAFIETVPVLSINTGSRNIAAKKAYRAVIDVFDFVRNRTLIYKKVDSTLRGNLGAEIDAIMDVTGKELTIFAAAYPKYRRYTIGGIQFLGNLPISSEEISKDPVKPVTDSIVKQIIRKQSKKKIAVINHRNINKGWNALTEKIKDENNKGNQIIVCDAVSENNLREIVLASLALEKLPIFAGSAGLAEALVNILEGVNSSKKKNRKRCNYDGSFLIVSGSINKINKKQIDFLQNFNDVGIFNLSTDSIFLKEYNQKQKLKNIVDSIIELLKKRRIVIITVEKRNNITGMIQKQLSKKIVATLGLITKLVITERESEIKGIILTGGETAAAVIKRLGAYGMWIDSEVDSGIPFGFLYKGPYDGFPVITKAGAFGREDTLRICVEYFFKCH